jgi:hypothetical protein
MQIRLGEHDTQLAAIYNVPLAIGKNLLDEKEEDAVTKQRWKERERIGVKK